MDKTKIKQLVREYQTAPSEKLFAKIKADLAEFTINFPRFISAKVDEDSLSDFYLYQDARLEYIIDHYQEEKSDFTTYFSICLKNTWYNFLKNKKTIETNYQLNEEIHEYKQPEEDESDKNQIKEYITNNYQKLKYLILILYFYHLFTEEDLLILQEQTKRSYTECLSYIEKIENEIFHKKKRKIFFEDYLKKTQYKKLKIDEVETNKKTKIEKTHNKYLERYHAVIVHPPYQLLADLLKIKVSYIKNTISRFKVKLKQDYRGSQVKELQLSYGE